MKIYTKTGDQGLTSLIGGKRVSKSDERLEAYGTIDELNSHIGLLISKINFKEKQDFLFQIQQDLFVIGSYLALETWDEIYQIPKIPSASIQAMEQKIDEMQITLPKLQYFILPGGSESASICHIARCVCRRSERAIVRIKTEIIENETIIQYLNRLSDYLFVLARKLIVLEKRDEKYWIPKK